MPDDSEQSAPESQDGAQVGPPGKRAYVKPTVTAYGSLARLTRSGKGSGTDGGGVMAMMCL